MNGDDINNEIKFLSEEKMHEQNRELNQKLAIESLSVGDKLWHTLHHEMWVVTKISVRFTDCFNGTPIVYVELNSQKTKHCQRYSFPSAYSVFDFAMLKEAVSKK